MKTHPNKCIESPEITECPKRLVGKVGNYCLSRGYCVWKYMANGERWCSPIRTRKDR